MLRSLSARFAAQFGALSPTIRGAFWMILSGLMFSLAALAVRQVTQNLHPIEAAFFRTAFGIFFMLPWLWSVGLIGLRTQHHGLYVLRAITSALAMFLWFGGLAVMPIADATAISFTTPIFISLAAVLYLKEPMLLNRWVGLGIGFAGTLVILRPGFAEVNIGALMVLGSGLFIAASAVLVKILAVNDAPDKIATYQILYMMPIVTIAALFVWRTPTWEETAWGIAIGGCSTLAQRAYTRAYAAADASAVTPFDFMRLLFSILLGVIWFSELPDLWTLTGGVVIFTATFFVVRGEGKKRP